jgi:hypothetical protein
MVEATKGELGWRNVKLLWVLSAVVVLSIALGALALWLLEPPFDNSPSQDLGIREHEGVLEVVVLTTCSVSELVAPDLRVGLSGLDYEDLRPVESRVYRSGTSPNVFRVVPESANWESDQAQVVSLAVEAVFSDGTTPRGFGVQVQSKDLAEGSSNAGSASAVEFEEWTKLCDPVP